MKRLLKYRLWALVAVNGLILVHVVFYYIFDKRAVGCVDFFGLATFLGVGKFTAGTLFLVALILITLCLGRVFCGWGCHFALFQDLLSRMLDRIGFRIPFRRTRLEVIVPPILFTVTLLYPIAAWWRYNGLPNSTSVDLSYPDVWHLLPGIKGVALILAVDVVVLTLLFGQRAFCRLICPYGLFLKIFHALSPTRVVKGGSCTDCGSCVRACPVSVPIKFELDRFEVVRDLNCMNCGDCVAACPTGALAIKPTRKAYRRVFATGLSGVAQPLGAEVVLLVATIIGLAAYRGREFGDFLAAGMGMSVGGLIVLAAWSRPNLRLAWPRHRKVVGARPIVVLAACYFAAGLLSQVIGLTLLATAKGALENREHARAARRYTQVHAFATLFRPFTFYLDDFDSRVGMHVERIGAEADRCMQVSAWRDAELLYRTVSLLDPTDIAADGNVGTALFKQGKYWEASASYLSVLRHDPNDLVVLYHLAMTRIQLGELDSAITIVQKILSIDTDGNAYQLIRDNPLFQLLRRDPRFQREMQTYRPRKVASHSDSREATP